MTDLRSPRALFALVLAVPALVLGGCAAGSPAGESGSEAETVSVVASTDVYGQIVEAVGGERVAVTSIIDSAAQDPHSFEPSARDQLTVSRADLIVENGGGYDAFVDGLIESSGSDAVVVTAAESSHDWPGEGGDDHDHAEDPDSAASDTAAPDDHDHDHAEDEHDSGDHDGHGHVAGFNEHVWYDPHTMVHVAEEIALELTALDRDGADVFAANLAEFEAGITALEDSLDQLADEYGGTGIFVTEPVPLYLTAAAGLDNLAPAAFTEAVEEGQDVPPATLVEALGLLASGDARVVITNAQTGGSETTAVLDEAAARSIPVVEFTETLPEGETYLSWMESNVAELRAALGA